MQAAIRHPKAGAARHRSGAPGGAKGLQRNSDFGSLGLPGCQVVGVGLRVSDFVDTVNRVTGETADCLPGSNYCSADSDIA